MVEVLLLLLALYKSPTKSVFNTPQDWSLEQRWLTVLLLLLALYNNPLFPLTLSSIPLLVHKKI